jgi:hypothetical protein
MVFMLLTRLKAIFEPSEILTEELNAEYRRAIDERLKDAVPRYPPSLIFSKMRGAFPSEVVQCGADLKWHCEAPSDGDAVTEYSPQLHALNYEWYFTPFGASEISREFVSSGNVTVCMGAPTVASAAIERNKNVILIDKNAHSLVRFPELMRASEIHVMDASLAGRVGLNADVLIFDSPWYIADTLAWLEAASHIVRPRGTIVFALYPSLIRAIIYLTRPRY